MKRLVAFATVMCLGILSSIPVSAGIIFDSLPPTIPSSGFAAFNAQDWAAQSFSIGTEPERITGITLTLSSNDLASTGAFYVDVFTYNGLGSHSVLIGQTLVADSTVTSLTAANYAVFSGDSGLVLAPNARYWLALEDAGGTAINWGYTTNTGGIGIAGEYYAFSKAGVLTTGLSSADGSYQMQIATTAVPEPGTIVLAGLVCGVGGVIYRRCAARPVAA